LVSSSFGDYTLLERLAVGGMAEVFLGKQRGIAGFEKLCAVKRILPEFSANAEFVAMFVNEAKIAARLSHPNIVHIFNFGRIGDHYFIAMEYVHGENLTRIMDRATTLQLRIPPPLAAMILARVCSGLHHAHRAVGDDGKPLGIVHRDVSPQNIVISYEGDVKIADFGIAKAIAVSPQVTGANLKGKLAYLSPEQVSGTPLDGRCDVFSAGVVLFELLAGRMLFGTSPPQAIFEAIAKLDAAAAVASIPDLDQRLGAVLVRALEPRVERRFATAEEMQAGLDEYLRQSGEGASTLQLANFMRLLFKDKLEPASGTPSALEHLDTPVEVARPGAAQHTALDLRDFPRWRIPLVAALVAVFLAAGLVAVSKIRTRRALSAEIAAALAEAAAPADAVAHFRQAFELSEEARTQHAAEYADALMRTGQALLEKGPSSAADDVRAAREHFEEVTRLIPDRPAPYVALGRASALSSDWPRAVAALEQALALDPRSADTQESLAYVYFQAQRFGDALEHYRQVLRLAGPRESIYYNIAACYEELENRPLACKTLQEGLVGGNRWAKLALKARNLGC
jgi:serine/threonine-protein kinase